MDDLDPETALLIVQLQLEDLDLAKTRRGKRSAGASQTPQDQDVAFQMLRQELTAQKICLEDQILCESISRAMMADSCVLAAEMEAEDVGRRDRALAHELQSGQEHGQEPQYTTVPESAFGGSGFLAKLTAKYMSAEQGMELFRDAKLANGTTTTTTRNSTTTPRTVAESSSQGSRRANGRATTAIDGRCEACHETLKFYDLATLPCAHEYCRDCLDQLVLLATTDESLFPPRCCRQPIPTDDPGIRMFISTKTHATFTAKRPELSTPNRIYCHRERCSAWIPPASITADVGSCPRCTSLTCAMCKAQAHRGNDCPRDEATHALLRTADQQAWQRCYQCRTVVELDTGCNHITCRCRAEFCYVCSARWKTCDCPQWDEDLLEGRAAQIADRRRARPLAIMPAPDPVPAPPVAAAPVPVPAAARAQAPDDEISRPPMLRIFDDPEPAGDDDFATLLAPPTPPLRAIRAEPERDADFFNPQHILDMQQIADYLRDNHECDHDHWRNMREPDRCEECGDYMKYYIYECQTCALRACQRCRRNRL